MKWLIKTYMAREHIETISELASLCGFTRRLLYDRIKDPKTFRIYELMALNNVLHFSDEDFLMLLRGREI